VVVIVHAPPYHTYFHHYKEMECFMDQLEDEFFAFGVDLVLSGHIHAYERTHGMYKCASFPSPSPSPHWRAAFEVAKACV
jgi:Icc-related predicted phosphoesterase